LNTKKSDYESLFEKAIMSADEGEYQKAIDSFKKVIEMKPDLFEAWHYLGTVYDEMGEYEEALINMKKALELNNDYIDAWIDISFVYIRMENFLEALDCLKKALELDEFNYEIWYDIGYTHYALNEHEKAIDCYNKALELTDRKDIDSLYNLACSLSILNKKKEAIEVLEEAIKLDPKIIEEIIEDTDFNNIVEEEAFKKLIKV